MGVRQLPEVAINLVKDFTKDNIQAALTAIRLDRDDPSASTEAFQAYYTNPVLNPLKFPALFFLVQSIDFQKSVKQANYVNARITAQVIGVIEDRTSNILTKRVWRYMDAVHSILDGVGLQSDNNKLKIVVYPERATFSEVYGQNKESSDAFRQEFTLDLTIECYENF
jgi:hypothetical protein